MQGLCLPCLFHELLCNLLMVLLVDRLMTSIMMLMNFLGFEIVSARSWLKTRKTINNSIITRNSNFFNKKTVIISSNHHHSQECPMIPPELIISAYFGAPHALRYSQFSTFHLLQLLERKWSQVDYMWMERMHPIEGNNRGWGVL